VALSGEVVDDLRLDVPEHRHEAARIRQVGVVQVQPGQGTRVDEGRHGIQPGALQEARLPDESVYLVAAREVRLGEIGPVLAGDTRDEDARHERQFVGK